MPQVGHRQHLRVLTAAELRPVVRDFARETATGLDGLQVWLLRWVSDQALDLLGRMFMAFELALQMPRQWRALRCPLIPKPSGVGHRSVGIYASAVRVWAKARRPECDEWEHHWARDYWGCGKQRRPLDAVWRWSGAAEVAAQQAGVQVATVLQDVSAYYESIGHARLLEEAVSTGFPQVLALAALAVYRVPRYVAYEGHTDGPHAPRRGIGPGCALATTFAKVFMLRKWTTWWRGSQR